VETEEHARAPLIWALDIATVTGFAIGRVGDRPTARSIQLVKPHATSDDLFGAAVAWFGDALATGPLPDMLAIEELLPPTARRGETSAAAQHRLAGLHGIVRGLARHAGVAEIVGVAVNDIRQHFIHDRRLHRDEAKRAVARMCKTLGWEVADSNCADAMALWSYAVALCDPISALKVTPLFGSWEQVANAKQSRR
jgi:crossover junction endodeoxyribonuclease RuvC